MNQDISLQCGSARTTLSLFGATITAFTVGGTDILFPEAMLPVGDILKRRGGIPILFPNAGPLPDSTPYALPQHGFARNRLWELLSRTEDTAVVRLHTIAAQHPNYPFDCSVDLEVWLSKDTLVETMTVHNMSSRPMPIAPGFHPYFAVSYEQRARAQVGLPDFSCAEYDWSEVQVFDRQPAVELILPGGGSVVLTQSEELHTVVVWSEPERDFICIEPWVGSAGALLDPNRVLMVQPNERVSISMALAVS